MRVEFGREEEQGTMDALMNRLLQAYPQLVGMTDGRIENIDMRYPNGLALKVRNALPASNTQRSNVAL